MYELLLEFAKPISFGVLMVLCVFGGWKLNTYYTGYQTSINQQIEKKVDNSLRVLEQQSAKSLTDTLEVLKNKKAEVITKEVPVYINRPIYSNLCLDQDGINTLLNLKNISSKERGMK